MTRPPVARGARRGRGLGGAAVRRDLDLIARWRPDLVILDEAQRIKNWNTIVARCVKRIHALCHCTHGNAAGKPPGRIDFHRAICGSALAGADVSIPDEPSHPQAGNG